MVLPGYALMAQGTQIHIAAWPGSSTSRHLLLSRAFASQAAAYVIDVGALLSSEDMSTKACKDVYKEVGSSDQPGESHIINPWGEVIAGPAEGETILIAEGSVEQILAAKSYCDVGAHYSRPDIFQLQVNRKSYRRVVMVNEAKFDDEPELIRED
jgi:nitrilase